MELNKMPKSKRRIGRWLAVGSTIVIIISIVVWMRTSPTKIEKPSAINATAPDVTTSSTNTLTQPETTNRQMIKLEVGDERSQITFNANGEFPRVSVPAGAKIVATVLFPDATPGQRISIQAEDGGSLLGNAEKGFALVDEKHQVSLEYQISTYDGLYRVTLRNGGDRRVLQFWVGDEPPVLARKVIS